MFWAELNSLSHGLNRQIVRHAAQKYSRIHKVFPAFFACLTKNLLDLSHMLCCFTQPRAELKDKVCVYDGMYCKFACLTKNLLDLSHMLCCFTQPKGARRKYRLLDKWVLRFWFIVERNWWFFCIAENELMQQTPYYRARHGASPQGEAYLNV